MQPCRDQGWISLSEPWLTILTQGERRSKSRVSWPNTSHPCLRRYSWLQQYLSPSS